MRHRPPGLSAGLAASLRSMPTALCVRFLSLHPLAWTRKSYGEEAEIRQGENQQRIQFCINATSNSSLRA
jgi:hypothetical protein